MVAKAIRLGLDEARARLRRTGARRVALFARLYARRFAVGIHGAAATIAARAVSVEPRRTGPQRRRFRALRVVVGEHLASEGRAAGRIADFTRRDGGVRTIDVHDSAAAIAFAIAVRGWIALPARRRRAVGVVVLSDPGRAVAARTRAGCGAAFAARRFGAGAVAVGHSAATIAAPIAERAFGASPTERCSRFAAAEACSSTGLTTSARFGRAAGSRTSARAGAPALSAASRAARLATSSARRRATLAARARRIVIGAPGPGEQHDERDGESGRMEHRIQSMPGAPKRHHSNLAEVTQTAAHRLHDAPRNPGLSERAATSESCGAARHRQRESIN